jgi:chitin disaccharide deacetylase
MSGRRIILCADDYGISPGVSSAIRDLIARRHINATSVMVVAPSFSPDEADALLTAAASHGAIGLHVTLTAPFAPLSRGFAPLSHGAFLSLATTLRRAHLRSLRPQLLTVEILRQFEAFVAAFGRPPDFVDGHQHVHLFPQIRDAFLRVTKEAAPQAWVRQCSRVVARKRLTDHKALLLDSLSRRFRGLAEKYGLRTNPAFAGTYTFRASADYPRLFENFLGGMPEGGVIMCHPGKVDAELSRVDTLTDLREREYAFFSNDAFPRLLAAQGLSL